MIRFIHAKQFTEKIALGEKPLLLDLTSEATYVKRHPRSSIHMPLSQLQNEKLVRSYQWSTGKDIILFTEDYETEPAWEAAELLHSYGFNNLYIYEGGKSKWVEDGLPFQAVHYPPEAPQPISKTIPPQKRVA